MITTLLTGEVEINTDDT